MHAKPKIVQVELAEVLARDGERIKIVFLQVAAEFAAALLVFSPNETGAKQNSRRNGRSNDVDPKLGLESADHLDRQDRQSRADHKFPVALEIVIFSTATSVGRLSAYATADAI